MISTDKTIFKTNSAVRLRMIEYAKKWEEVHIIVFSPKTVNQSANNSINEKISDNCWVYSTDSSHKFFYPFDAIKIGRKIIREKNIREITCQDPSLTAMAGVALKKKFGLPLEIQIHGDIGSPYFARSITNKIRLVLAKKYLSEADKIRVVSNRIKDYVEKVLERNSHRKVRPVIEVRPIEVNIEEIKNSPIVVDLRRKYKQFSHIVLMASRLEKEKNIELAIDVWQSVVKSFPKAGLVIVGSGSEELKLKNMVVNTGLTKSVIFENWVDKETLYSYYKTANLFLSTSFFEGYGMTLVEANAANCKIVSTDVGVAREAGAIIVEYNTEDVAKAVIGQLRRW
jgi:glycosyltransferase involved in cell wall biosynthesis